MKEISTFRYVEQNELYFSRINGSGLYSYTGDKLDSPSDTCFDTLECNIESHIDSFECPVFENIITGRRFFGKKIKRYGQLGDSNYIHCAKNPPKESSFLFWPEDVIRFPNDSTCKFATALEHWYSEEEESIFDDRITELVLFPLEEKIPGAIPLFNYLQQLDGKISYSNPKIKALAANLLTALESLNEDGYCYLDINFHRIFVDNFGNVHFDFSNLLFTSERFDTFDYTILPYTYPIEFAKPNLVQNDYAEKRNEADIVLQNFSIASMLFYLFYGRYACDGVNFLDERDTNMRYHYEKFRKMHYSPEFIFEDDNTQNRGNKNYLPEMENLQWIQSGWDDTPEPIRRLFIRTLREDNAESDNHNDESATPAEWIETFKREGWM